MKNNQTLYGAGILAVLVMLYYLTQAGAIDTKSVNADEFLVDKTEISTVELTGSKTTLFFTRDGSGWLLENYPVDSVRMNQFLALFSELQLDRLISKNTEKHSKYEVSDGSSRFHAKNGDGKDLLQLIIGKQGANYQETFVRADSENEVYAVKSNLSAYKNKTTKDFWDRSITQFDVNQVDQVTFNGELNYVLDREGAVWSYNGEQVDFEKVVNMLRPLENLKASNFADEIGSDNSFYQGLSIGFQDGSKLELNFFVKDANGALLLVEASGKDKLFEYSKSGLNRYKKDLGDLLPDSVPET